MNTDGIILFAKQPGPTSFKALNTIKKALGTNKVGHTGTLDSFAQGLLVVCTGRLTRLAGNITEFNKSYKAVLKFGEETDTLEYSGNVIKSTQLPTVETFTKAVSQFEGKIMQQPPLFSAIHLDGKRASDIARKGKSIDIPARPVTVFHSIIEDIKTTSEDRVEYALIDFSVSKGTYIRSLARDIGKACNSSAHLIGLYRTKVGNFNIEDAAGYNNLKKFTIDSAIKTQQEQITYKNIHPGPVKFVVTPEELVLQEEIRNKIQGITKETAQLCGFDTISLINEIAYEEFKNGKPLRSRNFTTNLHTLPINSNIAVFTENNFFTGLIEKDKEGKIRYKFVIN